MLLKCLLLKLLQRGDNRGQAIFELDNKEYNRKTPGRFLTKTRGDNSCCHTRTRSEYPWIHGSSPWVVESKMSLRGACLHATWQSQQNKLIGRDPHISPLDFLRMTILKIGRSLDDCLRNLGVTVNNKYRNRGG